MATTGNRRGGGTSMRAESETVDQTLDEANKHYAEYLELAEIAKLAELANPHRREPHRTDLPLTITLGGSR